MKSIKIFATIFFGLFCSTAFAQSPTYSLSPTGTFCGTSTIITLSTSVSNVQYQLVYPNGVNGATVYGNGSSISFGSVTSSAAGLGGTFLVYTVTNGVRSTSPISGGSLTFIPNPGGNVTASSTLVDANDPVTFTVVPTTPYPNYQYQWFSGGTAISNANSSTYTTTTSGNYTVQVRDNCGNTTLTCPALTTVPAIVTGSISPVSQNINYNANASTLTRGVATGGIGTYTYTWQSSPSINSQSSTWTDISGTTNALSYTPSALKASTYYRIKVTSGGDVNYSSQVLVNVYPQLVSGTIKSSQTINYNTTPAGLTSTAASGGNNVYNYTWQSSLDGSNWTNISGASTSSYSPSALTSTTSYRLVTTSNDAIPVISNQITITVYPKLVSGIVGSSQTINYNTTPTSLTSSAASGGNSIFTYQWQSSPNGSSWANITGASAANYSPGALTASTSYQLLTTSNGVTVTSNSVTITVFPQLFAGTISTNPQFINYNTVPTLPITSTAGNGGSGSITYKWQSSTSATGPWSYVTTGSDPTQLSYTPASLTTSTYYRVEVTSNGIHAYTAIPYLVTVYIQPPTISYPSPINLFINTPATAIKPTSSGGTIPAVNYATVSTLAGGSAYGYNDNSNGALALFNRSNGIVADQAGNVYVADYLNYVIRKITPSGSVSTFVGSGVSGSADGQGSAASFGSPLGISIDGLGNLYVLDYQKNNGYVALRKITPSGLVSTVIVNIGSTAIAIDTQNNIYITGDTYSQVIKISASGGATYITGNSALIAPFGIAVDKNGYVYVADRSGNQIKVMNPTTGVWSVFAGSGAVGYADGTGTAAIFQNPSSVAVDGSGNVYVADQNVYQSGQLGNVLIRKITPQGVVTTIAGGGALGTNGIGKSAGLGQTQNITLDNYGNLYTLEQTPFTAIRKISLLGYTISPSLPTGLTFDPTTGIISGNPTLLSSASNYTITGNNASGGSTSIISLAVINPPAPSISYSVTSSPLSFIINKPISPITPSNTGGTIPSNTQFGTVSTLAGGSAYGYSDNTNGALALFNRSNGIVADQAGNIYVADNLNSVIRKITPSGSVSTFVGSGVSGSADGQGSAASFGYPSGISIDGLGNLYVLDYQKNNGYVALRKITPSGLVSTVIVNIGSTTIAIDKQNNIYLTGDTYSQVIKISASGGATYITGNSALIAPFGIAVDKNGYVYVADRSGNQIKVMNPTTGVWSVFAGSGAVGYADGTGRSAIFQNPNGVAVDGSGNVYVADQNVYQGGQVGSVLIRKITPQGVVTTIAGGSTAVVNGVGKNADLGQTISITLDGYGNLYTLESLIATDIRKITLTGYDISPALPQGITLDSKTGIISGTPTASSPITTYTITGYNASGTSSTTVTLGVNPGIPINLSKGLNYVTTYQPRVAGILDNTSLIATINDRNKVQTTIQYIDGLGRPIQTVQYQASPTGNDIVLPQAYDQFGREVTKYLPYAIASNMPSDGSFKSDALSTSTTSTGAQFAFYNSSPPIGVTNITAPQAVSVFEPSPLNRVVEQGAPGDAWQPAGTAVTTLNTTSGHTIKMVYSSNDGINYWANWYSVNIDASGNRTLLFNNKYGTNQLYVTVSRDENWNNLGQIDQRLNSIEEYKDKEGHLILKRTYNYNTVTSSVEVLSTYYVYDDFGNLSFVLPPLSGGDNTNGVTSAINQITLNNLCYQYRYDERNRLSQKKLPGKGWEFIVYNQLDQPVLSQDSLQRKNNQWTVTKYDALGRVIVTGLWNAGSLISNTNLQANIYSGVQWDTKDYSNNLTQNPTGYVLNSYPQINGFLSVNYYDDYNFTGQPTAFNLLPTNSTTMIRGLPTASKTAVLNTVYNATTNTYNPKPDMLWKIIYYDGLGRNILTYAQHYLGGIVSPYNYDAINYTYDFTNLPTTVTRQHYNNTGSSIAAQLGVTIFNKYVYDQVGRKLRSWETINNGNAILLSQMVYNEVGQVWKKQLHSTDSTNFAQTIGYNYNERGWLLGSSAPLFTMHLQYNNNPDSISSFFPQFNGNIANQIWGTPGSLTNNYSYTYDNLNRLTGGTSNTNNNETGISYDLMGNIKTLNRTQANILIDQLSYTYTSAGNATNQLQSINDAAINNTIDNATIPTGTTSYTYDANGNMLSNTNTSITTKNKTFTYNLLNLPQTATVAAGTSTFTYDATGTKLRKVAVLGTTTTTTDYIRGIQYKNGLIDFIQSEEGKIALINGVYDFEYYLGDNLGNTRVTFNIQNTVATALQRDDYMPFGYEISNGSPANPKNEYLYNKKELQEELGEYDYGARFYDPLIARWMVVDPKAEKSRRWSPYNYVLNNPIRFIDPDGMFTIDGADPNANKGEANYFKDKDGKVTWTNATEDTKRIGNDMLKTDIGTKKLNDMISSKNNIKLVLNKTDAYLDPETGNKAGASTETTSDNNGKGGKSFTVTIYDKNVDTYSTTGQTLHGNSDLKVINPSKLTKDQIIGSLATHEATHVTEPEAYPNFNNIKSRKWEDPAYNNEHLFYEQLNIPGAIF